VRVLTVGNTYPPHDLGGGYELVWRSANEHLEAAGHTVRILTTDHRRPGAGPETADVHRDLRWYWRDHAFPRRSLLAALALERHNVRTLERHLREFSPEVVTWWAMGGLSMALLDVVRQHDLPAVAFVHDDWLDYGRRADQWHVRGRRHPRLSCLAERGTGVPAEIDLDRAARFVFVSETTQRRARMSAVAVPDSAIAHSGIDPSFLEGASASAPEWRGRLFYVGRVEPRKGVETIVEALPGLPGATLAVVGDGEPEYVAELTALARTLGVHDRLDMVGRVGRPDLPAHYDAADAVVFPVRWEEPWGLVPLEAMARGRPVIATGRGGSGEYLRDGENCLLFAAGAPDALVAAVTRLATSDELRQRLVEGGRPDAARHTEPAFNATVLAEVEAAAGRRGHATTPKRKTGQKATVVIPTIGRPETLRKTLGALARQTLPAERFDVVVVEDAKSEGGVEEVVSAAAANVSHARADRPGASAARNLGWRQATGDVVLYLGDDMVGHPRLLEEHLRRHEREAEDWVGVLGHVAWSPEVRVTPFMRWLEKGTQFDFASINGTTAGFGHFYTSNVSLKRAALEAVGGFDEERFPFHYEDLELGYRLFERAFKLIYERGARVQHLHQITLEGYRARMAGVAEAEMRWVELHPDLSPHYRDRMAEAADRPPYQGRTGRRLLRFVPESTPWLGRRVWENATFYYRQQLAPAYLEAWDRALARRAG
jgi:glycosyltransferase involved in cell wall biosynthesis/GT2 family glycosyltransferase